MARAVALSDANQDVQILLCDCVQVRDNHMTLMNQIPSSYILGDSLKAFLTLLTLGELDDQLRRSSMSSRP